MKPKSTNAPKMEITLCYQSLGVPFRAAPAEIEKAFMNIMSRINRELTSANPAKKKQAQEEQALFTAIYEQIKSSVTYQDSLLEEAKKAPLKNEPDKAYKKPTMRLMVCPRCKNSFNITYKACPHCKEPNQLVVDKRSDSFFTGRNIAILVFIALLCGGTALFLLKDRTKEPAPVKLDSSFANLSGASFDNHSGASLDNYSGAGQNAHFTNQSGTAQKP